MKKFLLTLAGMVASGLCMAASETGTHKVSFLSKYEVAGSKLAVKDINPSVPRNWDGYGFLVLEYRISTAQRFHVGLTTDHGGYNELRIMCYVPGAWNRLAIPLRFFTQRPGAAVDMAATYNRPRQTGWINLGGHRCPLTGVDSIGFRMQRPIGDQELEIRNLFLSRHDPGDLYMGSHPAVDEFGQSLLVDYPEKVSSLEELRRAWQAEDADTTSMAAYNYARYGGYKQKRLKGTGFFRTQKVDGRWWLVDPDGFLFLSVGVDCIHPDNGGSVRNLGLRGGMLKELPSMEVMEATNMLDRRSGEPRVSFGIWNLYRRYGDCYRREMYQNLVRRMERWGINTIANWSSDELKRMGKKAYLHQLYGLGIASDLMGLADVYDPQFKSQLHDDLMRQTESYRDDPWLIGYFFGNEPAWQNREEALVQMILDGSDRPIKNAAQNYLKEHGDDGKQRKAFVRETFRLFLMQAVEALREHDPHHLNLGMRFGDPNGLDEDFLKMCGQAFDVFSFNCYAEAPSSTVLDRVQQLTDRPVMIGEYHFGTIDRGYGQSLWQTENQRDRGVAYRYYTEQAYAHPSVVGTAYFQWSDQPLLGRMDGENYNCGLVDVTDRPYREQTEAMKETARRLYSIHSGKAEPVAQRAPRLLGHGGVKDRWNE
ncbi:MAG: hypothetical protein IJ244_03190 [Bacteroidaceae bacterium]|nr:hypothetical protein [Bacteroidaceae bacterium]